MLFQRVSKKQMGWGTGDPSSKGFTLASSMLIVLLLAGLSVGMMHLVDTENRLGSTDLDNVKAYYGAEAAMEKMMSDLSGLYTQQLAPTVSEIEALANASYQPVLTGVSYPDYSFTIPNVGGQPITETRMISSGPSEGLMAYIIPMTLGVTATGPIGAEVKMEREIEVALIPVFQFGIFSDTDLAYFPGPGFDFAGRVHTNGNLFLCTSSSSGLVFHSKMTAVGEVIRAELANGLGTIATGRDEPVLVPTAPGGCDGAQPACRDLQEDEGSKTGGPTSGDNTNWPTISLTDYNGGILNGDTGAKPLDLPFVAPGLRSIEIIRRPPTGEALSSLVAQSRLYNAAQLRVLLSDDPAEHPGSAGVRLANVTPYWDGTNYGATNTAFAEASTSRTPVGDYIQPGASDPWSLIEGYLLVESRRSDGTYVNVTEEWLDLGIARENADAILKFQRCEWNGSDGTTLSGCTLTDPEDFLPVGLYDTREGEVRDVSLGSGSSSCAIGGVMNTVELDVGNLKRWLEGVTGTTGTLTESATQNGYIFYFSDRRGNLPEPSGDKIGEYGFEDIINPPDANGVPDGVLADAEDVNENGTLETYGAANLGDAFGVANGDPTIRIDCNTLGRKNRVSGARHGLKLVNGALGNVPTKPDTTGGFTVASENMVYIVGNYNADNSGFGDPHAASAVIADAASFLSQDWEDWRSFRYPTTRNDRVADTSFYRIAVCAGKNKNWPHPSGWTTEQDYGLDGGTHNFLRYLERWSGEDFNYRGSLVSLYYSEYASGIYKCCDTVYSPPVRNYAFDTDFLTVDKLPPGTPRFRDIVNLGFRQILTAD